MKSSAALLALGRAAEAESYSLQALSADPSHAGANLNLGLAREAQRHLGRPVHVLRHEVDRRVVPAAGRRGFGQFGQHGILVHPEKTKTMLDEVLKPTSDCGPCDW